MESSTTTPAADEVIFQSKAGNLRIVKKPMRSTRIGETDRIETSKGETIEFYDGVFRTSDPETIDWLRNYESNGSEFWEVGSPEDRPTDASGLIKEIVSRGRAGDFNRVAEILVAERTATSRPDVLAACEAMLEDAGEDLPAKPATPLHEQQRVRMGPAAGITPGVSPDPVVGTPQVDPSTLESVPGAPPATDSVPVGQAPAGGETPSGVSESVPSAQGPLVGGEPSPGSETTTTAAEPPTTGAEPPIEGATGTESGIAGESSTAAPGAPAAPDEKTGD